MPSALTGLSMRHRLLLTLALSLVLVAASALLGLWQTQRLADTAESLYAERLVPLSLLREMARDLGPQGLGGVLNPVAGLRTQGSDRDAQRLADGLRRQWQAYLGTRLDTTEEALAQRLQPQLDTLLQAVPSASQASPEQVRALNQQRLAVMRQIDDLAGFQLSQAQLDTERTREATGEAAQLGVLLVSITALLSGLMIWTIWHRYDEERRAGDDGRERLHRMYQALSRTNQLIVQREAVLELGPTSELTLFDGLCRICVETGHARVATVVLHEGGSYVRAATAGDIERWMPGAPPRWTHDSSFGQSSMSTRAILSGTHQISNRPLQDPSVGGPGAPVIPPGVEALAAFPLRRNGQVVGALSIRADEQDFFDDTVTRLFDEITNDLSFALDNLTRERERAQALLHAREASEELRNLIQAMPIHMVLTRLPDGAVLVINDAMCRRYGISHDEVIGRRLMDLGVGMLPAYRKRYYELLKDHKDVVGFPVQASTRDGRVLSSYVYARRVRYHGQDCMIGCSVDMDGSTTIPEALDIVTKEIRKAEAGSEQSPGESVHADPQS
ncbi:GAF domain-containing protein [Roseateles sp. SL47]|uniref:GAF domain-containing protein n=1 Tax=Roseateles sp. SL47 TaxID=2995138 RepID=UPI0022706084|nr:GAF domain-containing protein [Roseateles sp. SL47]WAC73994.1 GAF domain-containing protein [Roseateles sp. SL47]